MVAVVYSPLVRLPPVILRQHSSKVLADHLLAGPTLRRIDLPQCAQTPRLATTRFDRREPLERLTVALRAWVRWHGHFLAFSNLMPPRVMGLCLVKFERCQVSNATILMEAGICFHAGWCR